jgi:pantothenate kinase
VKSGPISGLCKLPVAFLRDMLKSTRYGSLHRPRVKCMALSQLVLRGTCYEDLVEQLASRAIQMSKQRTKHQRHLIGIAGPPGGGKSTTARLVHERINFMAPDSATLLPMDGFHLYKAELDAMPNRQEAYDRRGCPWTFDAAAFARCVEKAKAIGVEPLSVPSFDHAAGDPCEGDIRIEVYHSIVLVEGNYVLLDEEPWAALKRDYFDDTWFIDVDIDVAMGRVFERQVAIGLDPETSRARIKGNDRPNAELIMRSKSAAKVIVPSSIPLKMK